MSNIEDTIRKLLAMAEGGTEHEAAIAAEKASELALKHNIDLLKLQTKPEDYAEGLLHQDLRAEQWVSNIIGGVSKLNAVQYYREQQRDGTQRYRLIGRPHNINITQAIGNYLIKEVKRLNTQHVKERDHLDNPSERSAYRKAFRLAASQRIYRRLLEKFNSLQETHLTGTTNALVVRDYFKTEEEGAKNFIKNKGVTVHIKHRRSISIRSYEGFRDGTEAGNRISLDTQVKGPNYGASRIAK